MKTRILTIAFSGIFLFSAARADVAAQTLPGNVHETSETYYPPQDSAVREKLRQWRDLKFGVLFHWGLYSIPGIVESWSICSEDVDWINRRRDLNYEDYKRWYRGLKDEFRPTSFDPAEWARIMRDAGMRYMIFTTKHHDGFCMFDTRQTDFSIASTPFGDEDGRDITAEVLRAFREQGFMTGTYFSKPDWSCPYYWWDQYATPDRRVNYDISRHPERWQQFRDYTSAQIHELMSWYGPVDILWLDGGWVAAPREDIGLDSIVTSVRKLQPGLITVDRTVSGPNENYLTPERGVPDGQLLVPWESCIPLSNDWGWVPDAPYKSPETVLRTLIEIVAKGGCMLLGIGPDADGRIEPEIQDILHEVGEWLRANGEAVYGTRCTPFYRYGDIWFTASADSTTLYAVYAPEREEGVAAPGELSWKVNLPKGKMRLLSTGQALKYRLQGDSVTVSLPRGIGEGPLAIAFEPAVREAYRNSAMPVDLRVSDLLRRMTLEEKAGQLLALQGWEMYSREGQDVGINAAFRSAVDSLCAGSLYAVMRADPWTRKTFDNGLDAALGLRTLNMMQRYAVDSTRLGIPLMMMEEAVHGLMAIDAVTFPTGLCAASTWNPDLMRRMGQVTAAQTAGRGASVCLGPVLDIAADPRWSRTEETFGEDPYLTGEIGAALVGGIQEGGRTVAALKHFAAYGSPRGGHNGAPSDINPLLLHNMHLPAFRQVLSGFSEDADSRAETVSPMIMTSYNTVDGIPVTCNAFLLDTLLRGQWGYDGVVISDLYSINGIVGAGVASDLREAAVMALTAGCDIDLGGSAYRRLAQAVRDGDVDEALVDRAVARVLRLKFALGLFEQPYVDEIPAETSQEVLAGAVALAEEVAQEGIVLLENKDGVLPLSRDDIRRIAVIGPNADMPYNMLGDYTAPQREGKVVTVLDGLRSAMPEAEVLYVRGCAVRDTAGAASGIAEAVRAAEQADVVVFVLGGSSARDFQTSYAETGAAVASVQVSDMESGEGMDRATLSLTGAQEALLRAVAATDTPIITVFIQGRPLDMTLASELSDALLTAWYPGERGGAALASVLLGDANPSGRLPLSVPRDAGQLPVYYQQGRVNDYTDMPGSPLYPFGYGLSYTAFSYDSIHVTVQDSHPVSGRTSAVLKVEVTITNTDSRFGCETLQLYLRDEVVSARVSEQHLVGFQKLSLAPGETATAVFELDAGALSSIDHSGCPVLESGMFTIMAGPSAALSPQSSVSASVRL
ncbi:MAG TPA: alpha-L-fucosidase [Candidatus Coprenecus merdipullorum]|nr:alpha-L-fucosidase [Candidatus Coprenecus merdipullorum]